MPVGKTTKSPGRKELNINIPSPYVPEPIITPVEKRKSFAIAKNKASYNRKARMNKVLRNVEKLEPICTQSDQKLTVLKTKQKR